MAYNSAINLDVTKSASSFSVSGANSKLSVSGEASILNDGSGIGHGKLLIGDSGENAFIEGSLIGGSGVVISTGNGVLTIHATGGGSTFNYNVTGLNFTTGITNPAYLEGRVFYDSNEKALSYYNDASGVTMNLGQETYVRVTNINATQISNGSVVYISGSSAGLPAVANAIASAEVTSFAVGVATMNIPPSGGTGYITNLGVIHNMNLSGYAAGTKLFLSDTVAGGLTSVKPTGNNYVTPVGYVMTSGVSGNFLVVPTDNKHSDNYYLNSKSITVQYPVSGDKIPMFWNESGVILRSVKSSVFNTGAGSPSCTYTITQSTSRSGTASLITASLAETNSTTGTTRNTFSNNQMSGGCYIFFECSAASNVTDIHVTLLH
jgi:hypothetical protein